MSRRVALSLCLLIAAGCGLQDLDPIPDPPPGADAALPDPNAPQAGEQCDARPYPQRDEPCVAELGGLPVGFAVLPPDTFCMGRPQDCEGLVVDRGQNGQDAFDYSARPVGIGHGFRLMQTEVTIAHWLAVLADRDGDVDVDPPYDPACVDLDCPVAGLSWASAAWFANKASDKAGLPRCYEIEGCNDAPPGPDFECDFVDFVDPESEELDSPFTCEGYRLPTEAEWEYAARLDSESVFFPLDLRCDWVPVGCVEEGDQALLGRIAWHCGVGLGPRPVALGVPQHPLGLHDLLGNVAEWVFDRRLPYATLPSTDPLGDYEVVDDLEFGAGFDRIARGGSWRQGPEFVNAMRRTTIEASEVLPSEIGFRLAVRFSDAHTCEPGFVLPAEPDPNDPPPDRPPPR